MIQDLFDTTCDLYTQSSTQNQIGEYIVTKTLLASNVSCRLERLSGSDRIYMDNIATYIDTVLYLLPRTDIEEWSYAVVNGIEYRIYNYDIVHGYSGSHHVECQMATDDRK